VIQKTKYEREMKINSSENISDKNQRKNSGRSLLSKIRRIGVYIILSVVLVIGGIYMYSAFSKRNIYINSFEVSDNLAKQGITGMSAANQLLDKIAIIRETKLDRYKKEYLNLLIIDTNSNAGKATAPIANYKIVEVHHNEGAKSTDIGISIDYIDRWFRKLLRLNYIEFSGTITSTEGVDNTLQLTMSDAEQEPQIFFGEVEDIEKLLFKGAEYVCKYSDPYSLALYQGISEPNTPTPRYLDTIQFILDNNDAKDHVIAYNMWAWILIDQRNYDEAELILRKGTKLAPDNIEILSNLANLLVQSEKFADAEEIYKRIISLGKDESTVWNNWGWLYNSWGKYNEAIPKIEKALDLDGENAGAYVNLGVSLRNTGREAEAKKAYFKAIKIDETNWLAYYNLGLCYMDEEAYAKAAENFKFAITYFPNFAQAYHELGKILFYQAKLDDALKMFSKAIEIDNTKIELYFSRGRCFLEQKEFAKAVKDFDEAFTHAQSYKIRHSKKIAAAYNNFGTQLRSKKKYDEAFQIFKKAYELNPKGEIETKNLASAYYNQGSLANTRKQYNKAEKYFRDAIQLDPHLAEAYHNLGNILKENKELNDAEKLLKKADQLKPNTPEILFSLGEIYRLLKKDAEAKSAYRRAMKLNPIYKVGAFSPSRYYPELRAW